MAANVNIYVAGDVVAGALASRRRRAENLMRVTCLSRRNIAENKRVLSFTRVKIEDIFPMEIPVSMQSRKFNILLSMVVTAVLPWLQKPGLKLGFKAKLISALV